LPSGTLTNNIIIQNGATGAGGNIKAQHNGTDWTLTGNVTATGNFIKSGGTSTQFLKANGSVDSSTYLTAATGVATVSLGVILGRTTDNSNGTGWTSVGSLNGDAKLSFGSAFIAGLYNAGTGNEVLYVQLLQQSALTAGTYNSVTVNDKGIVTAASNATSLGVGTAASGVTGEIRATGNITAYYTSDRSLKENIVPIAKALEKIDAITGVNFDWTEEYINDHGGEDDFFMRKNTVGVIAQEIETVLPEAVAMREDGLKAVRYELIIPLLIQAIKELKAEVQSLKAQK